MSPIAARTTRPPVTPPAIAPALEWDLPEAAEMIPRDEVVAAGELVGVVCVDVDVVDVDVDVNVDVDGVSEEVGRPSIRAS